MRVLLDECIDWRLSREFKDHDVTTVGKMGWASVKNGALLRLASENGFDVFVTVDRHLSQQQNLSGIPLIVVVLKTRTIVLRALRPLVPKVLNALTHAEPGAVLVIA